MPAAEGVKNIRHREFNSRRFVWFEWIRLLKTIPKFSAKNITAHKLLIAAHGVVADVGFDVGNDTGKIAEAFEGAAEEICPLVALEHWHAALGEMNHLPKIGVIPTAERNARNQVFFINEAKSLFAKNVIVISAELVKPDARLSECVDAAHGTDARLIPDGKSGAAENS